MGQKPSSDKLLTVKAWRSSDPFPSPTDYPEYNLPELQNKSNTAICFSGGGVSKSMVGTMGFLAGLRDAQLLDKVKYIGGITGGAVAIVIYCYSEMAAEDGVLLGPIRGPEDISLEYLNTMDIGCARKLVCSNFLLEVYGASSRSEKTQSWIEGVSSRLMQPAGISPGKLYSWNEETVADIIRRNGDAGLGKESFLLPRKDNGPFMVINWTLKEKSTLKGSLFKNDNDSESKGQIYRFIEATPLYIGQMKNHETHHGKRKLSVGGAIEPYAFAMKGGKPPAKGLSENEKKGELKVPMPHKIVDLLSVTGTSSLGALKRDQEANSIASWSYDYWSPSDTNPSITSTLFDDGKDIQTIPLIPFILRGVEKIICAIFADRNIDFIDLHDFGNKSNWKYSKKVSSKSFDPWLASFFGVLPSDNHSSLKNADYKRNQIFPFAFFEELVDGLYAAYEKGNGTFYRSKWTTIENKHYGVQGGKVVDITFYYLTSSSHWNNRLPSDVMDAINGVNKPTESLLTRSLSWSKIHREFDSFPFYDQSAPRYTEAESNLLANYVGWTILQNKDFFADILS